MDAFEEYLLGDGKLDYQKVWKDIANITGWDAQRRREIQYRHIEDWFQSREQSDSAKGKVSERESIPF
jgi:hypothetical protein|tara:strand:+ start:202 stop:405 length:204 start_codon:yes stop_codon:yes gene_type:complete